MGKDDEELSRRELLKKTAALAALAVTGAACSGDDDDDGQTTAGNSGSGQGQSGSGTSASGGNGPAAGNNAAGDGSGSGSGGATQAGAGGTTPRGGSGGADSGGSGGNPPEAGSMAVSGSGGGGADDGRIKVATVRRPDLDEAVALAVQLAGGLDEIEEGQSVFIKINAVSDRMVGTPGIRTSNEMMAAVIRLVKTRKPGRIIVGDRSARQFPNTMQVFQNAGIIAAAMAAGADEIYAAQSPTAAAGEWMMMQPPGYDMTWSGAGGILAMKKLLEADHLVNVPTCKNHRYALHSLSMKNFIGAIGDSSRDVLHYAESTGGNFESICRDIAVLNQMFSPLINILDATTALINGGPQGDGSDAVRTTPGLVMASKNRVAIDAMAISLIKLELGRTQIPQPDAAHPVLMSTKPFALPQLLHGSMRGIGPASATDIDLLFDDVPDAAALEMIYRS